MTAGSGGVVPGEHRVEGGRGELGMTVMVPAQISDGQGIVSPATKGARNRPASEAVPRIRWVHICRGLKTVAGKQYTQ